MPDTSFRLAELLLLEALPRSSHKRRLSRRVLTLSPFLVALASAVLLTSVLRTRSSGGQKLVLTEDAKAAAAIAKEKGNELYKQHTKESYVSALEKYEEAVRLDPDNKMYYSNCAACHIELACKKWKPREKILHYAKALNASLECTKRDNSWVKAYVRQATAEFEVLAQVSEWERRKAEELKWRKDSAKYRDGKKDVDMDLPYDEDVDGEIDASVKTIVDGASYSSCEVACRKGLQLEPGNAELRTRLQTLRDAGHATDVAQDREMRNQQAAAEQKAQGNAAVSSKRWKDAVGFYTKALEQDPLDHVFYSNRAACHAELEEFDKSLRDAERCIGLNSQFAKGHSRKAAALFYLGKYVEMEAAAKAGLAADPNSQALKDLLKQAQDETRDSPEVQAHMHQMREEKRRDQKMQELMNSLQGRGMNVLNANSLQGMGAEGMANLLQGMKNGGMGGGNFGGGIGGMAGKAGMTEDQMRAMARTMAQAESKTAS
eukprot:gnl/TRDRNA2_/TRDRNA2_148969_c0_seq2.p1 gnl/TRDRNA2_/TRDRNA2_148969_c0~~gnl/TRDRNA2_/TRDRNA2_148969_c0_seq2.p1  ORF type:complete len:489 (+),score=127.02 gnl/TRDRNA2_/TRDRNA2_148969_c0_seq2:57-1523(+)